MNNILKKMSFKLSGLNVTFKSKPLIVDGLAMQYYGLRQNDNKVRMIITGEDYEALAKKHPEARKDNWGDLGIAMEDMEISRSIQFFDYDFLIKEAIELENFFIISLERLLFVCMLNLRNEQYKMDVELIKDYCLQKHTNPEYLENAWHNFEVYKCAVDGIVYAGKYKK